MCVLAIVITSGSTLKFNLLTLLANLPLKRLETIDVQFKILRVMNSEPLSVVFVGGRVGVAGPSTSCDAIAS